MSAMHKFSYGLFVLSARENDKDNGCIINTGIQVTSHPNQIAVCVNKDNYTTKMIENTGCFNLSYLDVNTTFDTIQHFGFQSGKDVDKLNNYDGVARSENGLFYLTKQTNAMISVKVSQSIDLGSHMMFIGTTTQEEVLSDTASLTYQYYLDHIKPKPTKKRGFVCKVCGYVYEGDVLPDDFVCPLCKHGKDAFE